MIKTYKCSIAGAGLFADAARSFISLKPHLALEKDWNAADIVFICGDSCLTTTLTTQALKANKHVFCERPVGKTPQDILDVRQVEGAEQRLMFGLNYRYHPGIRKTRVLVDGGTLGTIIGLRGIFGKPASKDKKEDSGILLDLGIHMLDLLRYFGGDFDQVKCFTGNSFWKFDHEDNAYVLLQNNKGQTAFCHSSATFWKHTFRLDVILENGYIVIEDVFTDNGLFAREKLVVARRHADGTVQEETTYFDKDDSWDWALGEFEQSIAEQRQPVMNTSNDALKVMEIIQKAYSDISNLEGDNEKYSHLR
jgi:predicted dehydrogenase